MWGTHARNRASVCGLPIVWALRAWKCWRRWWQAKPIALPWRPHPARGRGGIDDPGFGRTGGSAPGRREDDHGLSDPRQRHPRGAVLLLHGGADVADPRRLHDLRDRGGATQERPGNGAQEHPHDRRRNADDVLLRLVGLQLQPAGTADRTELERLHQRCLPGRHPLVRHLRPEPHQQHQPDLLPGLPAVLLDDGLDHVRRAAGTGAALRLPGAGLPARLGRLDPRCRLGLERRRLADASLRVPRLDRIGSRPRRFRRLHTRRPLPARTADRQVHAGRHGANIQAPQHPYDVDGPDADLHRLLWLLRGLPGDRLRPWRRAGPTSTSARRRSARSR